MANTPPRDSLPADADADSYTQHRLSHATPDHLYITSRRCFIGPIPKGWLNSHRKEWYKHHLHINYSSRSATFSAGDNVSHQRNITGLDGQRVTRSVSQPEELSEEPEETQDEEEDITPTATPAAPASSPSNFDGSSSRPTRDKSNEGDIVDEAIPLAEVGTEAETSTNKAVGRSRNGGMLSPPAHTSGKIGTRVPRHGLSTSEDDAKSKASVYVDAPESPISTSHESQKPARMSTISSHNGTVSPTGSDLAGDDASTSPLITCASKTGTEDEAGDGTKQGPDIVLHNIESSPLDDTLEENGERLIPQQRKSGHVNFEFPGDSRRADFKSRVNQLDFKRPLRRVLKRRSDMEGQILKMERMLVRIDVTKEQKLPDDYDENSSESVVTQTLEKWREFMVVCRQASKAEGSDFVLQIYKTRVIPAIEDSKTRKKAAREIPLGKAHARVNLYSSLDKSVVIWLPGKRGTKIAILRPRTISQGVEWFTFLRGVLGIVRPTELLVSVPDLSVNLRLEEPFKDLEQPGDLIDYGDDDATISKRVANEQIAARRIIDRCLEMLKGSPKWATIIDNWSNENRFGLAWKRYDRLEWIHGVNERQMYGSMAMIKSHELELRPKRHYATNVQTRKGKNLEEPAPVEGFLVRLTSQKGAHQRLGKRFFKRLYFHTHDHYLLFSQPSKADPPPPPKFNGTRQSNGVPKASEIADGIPLIYAVNPYPVKDGQITWLSGMESYASRNHHDESALDEYRRKINNLSNCEGIIDLCNVKKVRKVHTDAQIADFSAGYESDSDAEGDLSDDLDDGDDGGMEGIDDARCFELVLKNGLVIRLQAYDKQTMKEWKQRLRALIKYWHNRHTSDIELLKHVRKRNLDQLQIDEETEAIVGQFAKKWEVTKSIASAELYNMCGISCCRAVHLSGPLYRKPRLHSVFTATQCILVPGKLLLFATTLRTRTGRSLPHIHQDKMDVIDLNDCYLYSGLLTENDLLYQNQTFDSNNPGHHAIPRMWPDDDWTSRDEDVMSCFVIWRPLNKGWFRAPSSNATDARRDSSTMSGNERIKASGNKRARLKRVSQLGATGRSVVFKARSRIERDRWVLAIATEIERLGGGEDVRVTTSGGK